MPLRLRATETESLRVVRKLNLRALPAATGTTRLRRSNRQPLIMAERRKRHGTSNWRRWREERQRYRKRRRRKAVQKRNLTTIPQTWQRMAAASACVRQELEPETPCVRRGREVLLLAPTGLRTATPESPQTPQMASIGCRRWCPWHAAANQAGSLYESHPRKHLCAIDISCGARHRNNLFAGLLGGIGSFSS